MAKIPEFFLAEIPPGIQIDPVYKINRESEYRADLREVLQRMWTDYLDYCPDDDFQEDAIKHFQACAWQMQLTLFLRQNFPLLPVSANGPDIRLTLPDGRVALVEAVSATPGTGPDAVRPPSSGHAYHSNVLGIIMRLRNAIDSKIKQHARWRTAGVVEATQPLIVAVTGGEISTAIDFFDLSEMEKAVYPLDDGAFHVKVRLDSGKSEEPTELKFGFRGSVEKRNGSAITTDVFVTDEAEYISAILYSPHHFANSHRMAGQEFRLIHNPNAVNPLPLGLLKCGLEAHVKNNELHFIDWQQIAAQGLST